MPAIGGIAQVGRDFAAYLLRRSGFFRRDALDLLMLRADRAKLACRVENATSLRQGSPKLPVCERRAVYLLFPISFVKCI